MIKKLLYGMVIIAGLASCNDDYTDWATAQSNAANDAVAKFTMTVTPSVSAINFETETADSIQLLTTNLQAGQTSQINLTISAADKTETVAIVASPTGKVASADIKAAVASLFGKAPTERTLSIATQADVTITTADGSIVVNKTADPFSLKVTLDAPYISEHYYLIGAPSAWLVSETSMPFTHSDQNVYDDPVFTVTFPVSDGDTWFAITDDKTLASGDWSYVLGCAEGNGANGMEGKIARRTELSDDGSWKISVDGDAKYVRMTINMMDYTYTLEKLNFSEYVYLPGDANGWSFTADCLRGANYDGEYSGFAMIGGEWGWKITPAQNWDSSYGIGATDGVISLGGGNIMEGSTAELRYAVVNLAKLTYSLTTISSVSIIGEPTGDSSWGTDLELTQSSENPRVWTYTGHLDAGSFKFRMNHGWDINLGGASADALEQNGVNLNIAAAGDYTVTLTLSGNGVSSYTLTSK